MKGLWDLKEELNKILRNYLFIFGQQYPRSLSGDVKHDGQPDLSEMIAGAKVDDIWRRDGLDTEYDELPDGSVMNTSKRIGEAGGMEGISTKHDQLLDGSVMHADENIGEIGRSVESGLVLCLWMRRSERLMYRWNVGLPCYIDDRQID